MAAIKGDKTYEEIATKFSISKSMISKWRDELMKGGFSFYGKAGKEQKSNAQEVIEQEALSTNWTINYAGRVFKKVCKQIQSTVDQRECQDPIISTNRN